MRTPRTPSPDPFDLPDGRRRRGDHPRGGRGRRGGFDAGWETGPRGGRGHGGPGGRRGGGRRGRGQMRAAILLLLAEEPKHGYQIITDLAERSEGGWQPSPGAVYPAIAQLQDEGLVEVADDGGRRLASLTDAGREHVEAHRDELGTPWEQTGPRGPGRELHGAMRSLGGAVEQVARTGTPEQATATAEILAAARRDVYLLLAGE
ncbi:PadR family transcriptional regulator [Isoptericola croceus]|uniref:PadR family transcriptional regulator n=1 Tax=Isoptericola croceus TaxID=3031406 RepID=UPI0023F925CE|nr:PadR family transcriptional regulator [Isoptericola croceus]